MKKASLIFLFLTALALLWGCRRQETEQADYYIYYLNKDETAVEGFAYQPQTVSTMEMVDEFLDMLRSDPENLDYKRTIPESIEIRSYQLDNDQLYLYFDDKYQAQENSFEVLSRAAIVRTLNQIPGVSMLFFYSGDKPLTDSQGNPVGVMVAEDFIDTTGESMNAYQRTSLTLYFANQDGDRLVKDTVDVVYSTNMSIEKLVVEQLIEGSDKEDCYAAVSSQTTLLSIFVTDGVCYVNFDEGFLGEDHDVSERIPIYAVVNSLTELSGINKVQIAINGETDRKYLESITLDSAFERNLDMLETEEEDVVE